MKRIIIALFIIIFFVCDLSFAGEFDLTPIPGGSSGSTTINDSAGNGDSTVTYSADKIFDLLALKQALDAELTALAGLTSAANAIPYFTGSGTAGVISSSANMVSLLGSDSYATARTNLGVAIGTNVQAHSDILDGIAGVTPANNGIFGYNNSGTLGLYTNHSHDDSAAQFYSATASKGTFKMLMTSMGDGIAGTFTPVCTGACTLTTESYGAGTYTVVDKTSTQTLTNKTLTSPTLTTPIITSLEVLIDCNGEADPYAYCTSANASTLTATQTSRTIINSYGRGEAQTVTLPAAATGMTFIAMVGTQHNSAWKIQRAGSDTITWSSGGTDTAGKTYFQETNQAVGSRVSCITYKTGASAWTWLCGSVTGTWVTD